ncbi:hypothetical protein AB8615_04245 [Litorimonas sp. RW-G-Af-16]
MRILSILSATVLMSAPAFAADLGMYRPGITVSQRGRGRCGYLR